MRCGFPFQDWDGALVRCEGGEDLQVRPDHTFVFMMNNVSGILGHNLQTCQYCFMFVKNVDGVPSASASFARRPQSTIYLKTINCGGRQNLINKCHRWKEWKYVQSELAFAQQFDFYHTGRLYESVKIGQSFKFQLEDTQKGPHPPIDQWQCTEWLKNQTLINIYFTEILVSEFDIWHDGGWPMAPGDWNYWPASSPNPCNFMASYWSMTYTILSHNWVNMREDSWPRNMRLGGGGVQGQG